MGIAPEDTAAIQGQTAPSDRGAMDDSLFCHRRPVMVLRTVSLAMPLATAATLAAAYAAWPLSRHLAMFLLCGHHLLAGPVGLLAYASGSMWLLLPGVPLAWFLLWVLGEHWLRRHVQSVDEHWVPWVCACVLVWFVPGCVLALLLQPYADLR